MTVNKQLMKKKNHSIEFNTEFIISKVYELPKARKKEIKKERKMYAP